MILLDYPSIDDGYYFRYDGMLFGPYCADGQYKPTNYTFKSDRGAFIEERGIFGENNVFHRKYEGRLTYHRPLVCLTPDPSYESPQRLIGEAYQAGKKTSITLEKGIAADGASRIVRRYYNKYGGGDMTMTIAWEQLADAVWRQYTVVTNVDRPKRPWSYQIAEYSMYDSSTIRQWRIKRTQRHWQLHATVDVGFDLRYDTTLEQIKHIHMAIGTLIPSVNETTIYCTPYSFSGTWDVSPKLLLDGVLSLCDKKLYGVSSPIQDLDYGDLAMEAVQKFHINRINMLEFLSDFRHPTRLIPKLRNLSKLKDLANLHLTVKYGVLPTIDDLKSIWEAFRRYKPYYDKNGFVTVTHCRVLNQELDILQCRSEQRIKLAIDKEDNEFQALLESMNSLGTLPKLSNLWDLVPYSFVIDWFIGVGNLLERIDTRRELARLNIRYVTMSRKDTMEFSVAGLGLPITGKLAAVQYHRWVSDHCPAPPLSLQLKTDAFKHLIEGGALIIQRTKY